VTFPVTRMRRLRAGATIRSLVRETDLTPSRLVWPLFVDATADAPRPVPSMPGIDRLPPRAVVEAADRARELGIAVLLFGIPETKDPSGSQAHRADGVVQRAVAQIKQRQPELLVITDVCLCEYTDHGHCGILAADGSVDNDASVELLAMTAVSHAAAGADIVAPSDMMDGRVAGLREQLDSSGFDSTPIMAYSAKFASAYYGPFRDAADSTPASGDRRAYQMDPANGREALRELRLDADEGADILMVKPALPYLDIIARARQATPLPLAAYSVSGEYAMLEAAAAAGCLDREAAILESLTAIRRAGADIVITYHAREVAEWLTA
jgi:porphobilinogen synthase